ncbi:Lysophospholipase NTE1 [Smittium mucronatum]|uniref:Lysophospholipase NTE1 n=1 Tax=Smittium mucronatum TaxID=133383 RepID=A0A1R0GVK1_9FUNG|nr:Lysophospholipase NTE1 [Smittium mucronatum]
MKIPISFFRCLLACLLVLTLVISNDLLDDTTDFSNPSRAQQEKLTLQKIKTELQAEKWKIQGFLEKYFGLLITRDLFFIVVFVVEKLYLLLLGFLYGLLITTRYLFSSIYSNHDTQFSQSSDFKPPLGISLNEIEVSDGEYTPVHHKKSQSPLHSNRFEFNSGFGSGFNSGGFNPTVGINFLDAFLKSIQIFGYLEDAVFYELSRQLQTQRVLAGERLYSIEKRKDFCVVVEGHITVYAIDKSPSFPDSFSQTSTFDDPYEDIYSDSSNFSESDQELLLIPSSTQSKSEGKYFSRRSLNSNQILREVGQGNILSGTLQLLDIFTENLKDSASHPDSKSQSNFSPIVGIARVDTTLAVIPEKAFKRVRERFPKSAAHMIQVILTRLQRVTLFTMQNYLNLENRVISFEQRLASITIDPNNNIFSPKHQIYSLNNQRESDLSRSTTSESLLDTIEKIKTLCSMEFNSQKLNSESLQEFSPDRFHSNLSSHNNSENQTATFEKLKNSNHYSSPRSFSDTLGNGLEISYSLINKNSVIFIDEGSMDTLGRLHGPTLLKKTFSLSKASSSSSLNKSPTPSYEMEKDSLFFHYTQPDSEDFWPVPKAKEFNDIYDLSVNLVSKSLGITYLDKFRKPSSMSLVSHMDPSSGSVVDVSNSPQVSSSDQSTTSSKNFSSQPIPIFPKINSQDNSNSIDNRRYLSSRKGSLNSGGKFFNFKDHMPSYSGSTFSFNDLKLIYAPPGKVVIKKGQRPDGLFFVIDGTVELSDHIPETDSYSGNSVSLNNVSSIPVPTSIGESVDIPQVSEDMTNIALKIQTAFDEVSEKDLADSEKNVYLKIKSIIDSKEQGNNFQKKSINSKNNYKDSDAFIGNHSKHSNHNRRNKFLEFKSKSRKVGSGGMIGYFSAINDMPSNVTVLVSRRNPGHENKNRGAILAYLPLSSVTKLVHDFPVVYLTLARRVSKSLSFLVHHIDYALDWIRIPGGKLIYKSGSKSDAVHIVLSGRLRALSESPDPKKNKSVLSEYGQGESIGETDALAGDKRSFSLYTIRDSELVWIPKTLFTILVSIYPELTFHISKLIASRILKHSIKDQDRSYYEWNSASQHSIKNNPYLGQNVNNLFKEPLDSWNSNSNLKTICILPVNMSVPINEFSSRLYEALVETHGPSIALLKNSSVLENVGRNAFSRAGKLKTQSWLAELEEKRKMVLYVADSDVDSPWTLRCIRQADCILIIGLGDGDPSVGPFEQLVLATGSTAKKELVLLHPERSCLPGSTRKWLSYRQWIHTHHHIQMPTVSGDKNGGKLNLPRTKSVFGISKDTQIVRKNNIFGFFKYLYTKLFGIFEQDNNDQVNIPIEKSEGGKKKNSSNYRNGNKSSNDAASDQELKLKGFFDYPNSTSGALHNIKGHFKSYYKKFISKHRRTVSIPYKGTRSDFFRLARRLCNRSVGLVLSGGGARGNAHLGVLRAFEEAGIPVDMIGGTSIGAFYSGLYAQEPDTVSIWLRAKLFSRHMNSMWRTILDVTWPILSYTTGNEFNRALWKVFKSTEIEDLWLPYYCVTTNVTHSRLEVHTSGTLWKYCRASMSLSGFLPPLCDPNGEMLVDGGYLDNLPVDYMRYGFGANMIFAIDIAGEDDTNPVYYGESVSGLGVILNNLNPFRKYKIPNLSDIQSRLAYVSSVQTLKSSKSFPGVVYAKIPPRSCGVLEFSKFNEVYKKGYLYACSWVNYWRSNGNLDIWVKNRKRPIPINRKKSKEGFSRSHNANKVMPKNDKNINFVRKHHSSSKKVQSKNSRYSHLFELGADSDLMLHGDVKLMAPVRQIESQGTTKLESGELTRSVSAPKLFKDFKIYQSLSDGVDF